LAEIHAIILTLNEAQHISRCIESIRAICKTILVVDSGSTDDTVEIARSLGAAVVVHPWLNYATQFNHGITAMVGHSGWLMRIDADEYMTLESAASAMALLDKAPTEVSGILVRRQIIFLGRRIRWGGVEPNWQLRLWRAGQGACEQRWMDEHIMVSGRVIKSDIDIVDENLNSLDWWTTKHNQYASREVIDILSSRGLFLNNDDINLSNASRQAIVKRFIKDNLYNRLPAGLRSIMYFAYRYFFRLGFLDGRSGYFFHILQGFWYRTLVDAKASEVESFAATAGVSIGEAVRIKTGFDPAPTTAKEA